MRFLVVSNVPVLGGSPLVAIDLARALAARGHEPIFAVAPGRTHDRAEAEGLRTAPLPPPTATQSELRRAVHDLWEVHRPDLVHAYELPPIDAAWSLAARNGVPVVGSMLGLPNEARRLPREVPVLVGGRASLAASLIATRPGPVWALPLPVDLERDRPLEDRAAARRQLGLPPSGPVVAVVSRLAGREILTGIESTIRAVGRLGDAGPHLLIAGDGPGRAQIEALAGACCGGRAHLVGVLEDPRPAYAAADVLVGRGTTVARALAHGVAAIVLDEDATPCLASAESAAFYQHEEFVSVPRPTSTAPPDEQLEALLARLVDDPDERARVAAEGRELIRSTRALETCARELERVYADVIAHPVPQWRVVRDVARQRYIAWRRQRSRRQRPARSAAPGVG